MSHFARGANTKKKYRNTHGLSLPIMEGFALTMRSFQALIAVFFLTACATALAEGQTYDFSSAKPVEDYLSFAKQKSARPYMTIEAGEDGDILTFRSEDGEGELAVFQPDGRSPGVVREIEVVLRTEGTVSFGVFARASGWDEPAYLTFFSPDAEGTARLNLAKNPLSVSQKLSEGLLASKHVKGAYDQTLWHALRIRFSDEADGSVSWTADLVEWPENRVVLSVAAQDTKNPLTSGDQLGLRFFCGTQGAIQVKSITLAE